MNKLKILCLSSYAKEHSGNMGGDCYDALREAGHDVTWGFEGIERLNSIVSNYFPNRDKRPAFLKLISRAVSFIKRIFGYNPNYYFLVENEQKPKLPAKLDVSHIQGSYDLIIIFFTVRMISAKTLYDLYQKFMCPIYAMNIDFYPISGGCFFYSGCKNYLKECRDCPHFDIFRKNQAHKNFLIKKDIYNKIDFTYLSNSWMISFAESNKILEGAKAEKMSFIINEEIYKPKNRIKCRQNIGLKNEYDLVMLARYDSHPRKGFGFIVDSIKMLISRKEEIGDRLLLVIVGDGYDNNTIKLGIPVLVLGKIPYELLIDAYNAADVFLSSSIDDAGPSMVNQSMACGTPVISFNIGTSIDVLHNGISGFMASEISAESFEMCLEKMLNLSKEERQMLRNTTRETALKYNSKKTFVETVERVYKTSRNYK